MHLFIKPNQRTSTRVLNNLENSVKLRDQNNYNCAVGAQLLLLPQNVNEIAGLASRLKEHWRWIIWLLSPIRNIL